MRVLWMVAVNFAAAIVWAEPPPPSWSAFGPGEETQYEVRWLGLPAGTASVTVGWEIDRGGKKVLPLVCIGESGRLASLYPIRDRFTSFFESATQVSSGAEFLADEGRRRRRERFRFEGERAFSDRQFEGSEASTRTFEVPVSTMDLASAAFRLRNLPLSEGAVHDMPIFTGDKVYQLHAVVEGRETIQNTLGVLEVWRVKINTDFNDKLKTKRDISFYLTTDERHLPVRATAEFVLGTVVLEATSYRFGQPMKR
jgi:Protein of unknown function (DUF3108)